MVELRRPASRKMAEMEENTAEVRQVTRHKMSGMEEKSVDMAREMRRATRCMKA